MLTTRTKLTIAGVGMIALTSCGTPQAAPAPTPTVTVTSAPEIVEVEVTPQVCMDAIQGMADLMMLQLDVREKTPKLLRAFDSNDVAAAEAYSSGIIAKHEQFDRDFPAVSDLMDECKYLQ